MDKLSYQQWKEQTFVNDESFKYYCVDKVRKYVAIFKVDENNNFKALTNVDLKEIASRINPAYVKDILKAFESEDVMNYFYTNKCEKDEANNLYHMKG